ncbi:hypothetical protein, conserved [Plasmodium gonderi]|uniref:Uncharacterized protein n=1 Tax=Plasmodium gonderi TaxID=77519 RepID=A0A1Y1JP62_PLAGO|nr:hypothetical protein, conserved [Plasmodium gonderi]GAW81834.1 hypothetical protein, conserved [Plasmodium gonderi]
MNRATLEKTVFNNKKLTNNEKSCRNYTDSLRSLTTSQLRIDRSKNLLLHRNISNTQMRNLPNFDGTKCRNSITDDKSRNCKDKLNGSTEQKIMEYKNGSTAMNTTNNVGNSKNRGYINLLRNNVKNVINKIINRKSVLGTNDNNLVDNDTKMNKKENNNIEVSKKPQLSRTISELTELKSVPVNSEKKINVNKDVRRINENISSVRRTWMNVKHDNKQITSIGTIKDPIDYANRKVQLDRIRIPTNDKKNSEKKIFHRNGDCMEEGATCRSSQLGKFTIACEKNKPTNEKIRNGTMKDTPRTSLTMHKQVQKAYASVVIGTRDNIISQNGRMSPLIGKGTNSLINKTSDLKKNGISKPFILGISKNEKIAKKQTFYTPSYTSRREKYLGRNNSPNFMYNDSFHKNLKMTLINTIMNPEKEEHVEGKLENKNGNSELSRRNTILNKNDLLNREKIKSVIKCASTADKDNLKSKGNEKKCAPHIFETKQQFIKRYSTMVRNRNSISQKSNMNGNGNTSIDKGSNVESMKQHSTIQRNGSLTISNSKLKFNTEDNFSRESGRHSKLKEKSIHNIASSSVKCRNNEPNDVLPLERYEINGESNLILKSTQSAKVAFTTFGSKHNNNKVSKNGKTRCSLYKQEEIRTKNELSPINMNKNKAKQLSTLNFQTKNVKNMLIKNKECKIQGITMKSSHSPINNQGTKLIPIQIVNKLKKNFKQIYSSTHYTVLKAHSKKDVNNENKSFSEMGDDVGYNSNDEDHNIMSYYIMNGEKKEQDKEQDNENYSAEKETYVILPSEETAKNVQQCGQKSNGICKENMTNYDPSLINSEPTKKFLKTCLYEDVSCTTVMMLNNNMNDEENKVNCITPSLMDKTQSQCHVNLDYSDRLIRPNVKIENVLAYEETEYFSPSEGKKSHNDVEKMNEQEGPTNYEQEGPTNYEQEGPTNYEQGGPTNYEQGGPTNYEQGGPTNYEQGDPTNYEQGDPTNYEQDDPTNYEQDNPTNYEQDDPTNYEQEDPTNYEQDEHTNYEQNESDEMDSSPKAKNESLENTSSENATPVHDVSAECNGVYVQAGGYKTDDLSTNTIIHCGALVRGEVEENCNVGETHSDEKVDDFKKEKNKLGVDESGFMTDVKRKIFHVDRLSGSVASHVHLIGTAEADVKEEATEEAEADGADRADEADTCKNVSTLRGSINVLNKKHSSGDEKNGDITEIVHAKNNDYVCIRVESEDEQVITENVKLYLKQKSHEEGLTMNCSEVPSKSCVSSKNESHEECQPKDSDVNMCKLNTPQNGQKNYDNQWINETRNVVLTSKILDEIKVNNSKQEMSTLGECHEQSWDTTLSGAKSDECEKTLSGTISSKCENIGKSKNIDNVKNVHTHYDSCNEWEGIQQVETHNDVIPLRTNLSKENVDTLGKHKLGPADNAREMNSTICEDDQKAEGKRKTNLKTPKVANNTFFPLKKHKVIRKNSMHNIYLKFKKNYNLSLSKHKIKETKIGSYDGKRKKVYKHLNRVQGLESEKVMKVWDETQSTAEGAEFRSNEQDVDKLRRNKRRKIETFSINFTTSNRVIKKKKTHIISPVEKCLQGEVKHMIMKGSKRGEGRKERKRKKKKKKKKKKLNKNDVGEARVEDDVGEARVEDDVGEARVEDDVGEARVEDDVGEARVEDDVGEARVEDDVGEARVEDNVEKARVENALGKEKTDVPTCTSADAVFYEHGWMEIILQLINNDNFDLGEKLMLLIFEKEEEIYRTFVNAERSDACADYDSREHKTSEERKNLSVHNNDDDPKGRSKKKLSHFMDQIFHNCPSDWPLLDIGILIIVSQIVCHIFNMNKWKYFNKGCLMFEKYCIGILLNSSIINCNKNGNTILMFEHFFFFKIITSMNCELSEEVIKYRTNYLKNDHVVKEKTILDVIFLALAYYITASQNLNEYRRENNILYYLNLFHKNRSERRRDPFGNYGSKGIRNKIKYNKIKKRKLSVTNIGRNLSRKSTKKRFSENLHKNKINEDEYIYEKYKRRRMTYEKNVKRRLSILKTTKCINRIEKNSMNQTNACLSMNHRKETLKEKNNKKELKANQVDKFFLFKNNKIETIVQYQTRTDFEKLLCLIIIEIFNLIYDNREYSVKNVLIIRKFFRVFLNFAQKRFIALSIRAHSGQCARVDKSWDSVGTDVNDVVENETQNDVSDVVGNGAGGDTRRQSLFDINHIEFNRTNGGVVKNTSEEILPSPRQIYDNYYNVWIWVERIFCENFYEINNMMYNVSMENNWLEEDYKLSANYGKIEIISKNVKRFSSLQKRNCAVLRKYWITFGVKEQREESEQCIGNEVSAGERRSTTPSVRSSLEVSPSADTSLVRANGMVSNEWGIPKGYMDKEEKIYKNKTLLKLEKKDCLFDMLTFHFLSAVECICNVYQSIEEIPSFLHLKKENYFMNYMGGSNQGGSNERRSYQRECSDGVVVSPFLNGSISEKCELDKGFSSPSQVLALVNYHMDSNNYDKMEMQIRNRTNGIPEDNSILWLKKIKRRLKIYDIQWHEEYEKQYLNLATYIGILKSKFKENKLFHNILKRNINSIWLNKNQIYLQYIQITINCKFFLGSSYNDIYEFIKKNYTFVFSMVMQLLRMDERSTQFDLEEASVSEEEPLLATRIRHLPGNTFHRARTVSLDNEKSTAASASVTAAAHASTDSVIFLEKEAEAKKQFLEDNFILIAWEIANFYFCILYYKFELKEILQELQKWMQIFHKMEGGENGSFFIYKHRCASYLIHILIFMNEYTYAHRIMKHVSREFLQSDQREVKRCKREVLVRSVERGNNYFQTENENVVKEDSNITWNQSQDDQRKGEIFLISKYEKKKILHWHVINKCYLYNKWINYMMKKYNCLIPFFLRKKNIVKLILFNNKNVQILMKKKKDKILIIKVLKKMQKLQNIILSLYCLCVKLYKGYYYYSSMLHYHTSQHILLASKYLNIHIKKRDAEINYTPSTSNYRDKLKADQVLPRNPLLNDVLPQIPISTRLVTPDRNVVDLFNMNYFSPVGAYNLDGYTPNGTAPNSTAQNGCTPNDDTATNLGAEKWSTPKVHYVHGENPLRDAPQNDNPYCNEGRENNEDMFYLNALILSIQIQYTLSVCIIICAELFIFPSKLQKLVGVREAYKLNPPSVPKYTSYVRALFNYKILRKHYRILNGHNFSKMKGKNTRRVIRKKEKKKKKKRQERVEIINSSRRKVNDMDKYFVDYVAITSTGKNHSEYFSPDGNKIHNSKDTHDNRPTTCYSTSQCCVNYDYDEKMYIQRNIQNWMIDDLDYNKWNTQVERDCLSDVIMERSHDSLVVTENKSTLSDCIPGRYENFKKSILKKRRKNLFVQEDRLKKRGSSSNNSMQQRAKGSRNMSNAKKVCPNCEIFSNSGIFSLGTLDKVETKNAYHILIQISTWLSKNSAVQLVWIGQKLFKMCLPEFLCIVLALQANMFMNKNILTNIKRIDCILKLCSESPQLVYFATECLKNYKNKTNLKIYKNYFKVNKKYKEIFLKQKKDIIDSKDALFQLCEHFLCSHISDSGTT